MEWKCHLIFTLLPRWARLPSHRDLPAGSFQHPRQETLTHFQLCLHTFLLISLVLRGSGPNGHPLIIIWSIAISSWKAPPPAEPFLLMFLPKLPYSPCTQFIQPIQTLREASRGSAKEACLRLSPSVPEANPFLLFLCNPLGSGSGFPQATSILFVFQPLFPEKSHFFMRPFPNSLGKEWSPLETYPHGAYATHYSWPRNNDNDDDDDNSDSQISFCKQTLDTHTFY